MSEPSHIVPAMSEETTRDLRDALAAASEARAEADLQKKKCLTELAEGLAGRLDALAKRVAQAEPEVTKALGKTGIQQLRTELDHEAALLAADVQGAADRITWPVPQSHYDKAEEGKIHSALFDYMYGPRVDKLAAVFKRHGYSIHDNNSRQAQGLVLPQSLYEQEKFGPVAQALNVLGEAERVVAEARKADDSSTVDDLWGG
jgi:hypothetical protein